MKFCMLPVLLLLQLAGLNAQPVITLTDTSHWHPIGKYTSYLKHARFSNINNILRSDVQSQFELYKQDSPNFGSIADAVWFRFAVTKQIDKEFYLQIGSAFIDSIALYMVIDNQVQQAQLSGDNYVFSQRAIKVTTFLFPLKLPLGTTQTYFLRTKTMQPFFFPLRVGTLSSFMEDSHKLDLLQGIYVGFMLLIILYNLFLFFSTKEKIYLYYVAYVVSITWFMSTVFQYVFEFFWPGLPIINQYAVASTAFTILTATVFTRAFLHTKKLVPRLHSFSSIFIGWGILVIVLVITPFKLQALMLAQAGIMVMAIYFLVAGIAVLRRGYHPAKFYLLAWGFLIVGFIAAILETVNILPVMPYINSMQIGSAIEVMLLSFALADRINTYKKQREEAQAKALSMAHEKAELIQQQNILLEQKVNERTIAVTNSMNELKQAQAQLVQSEKMASLGELTAGIAHEIQNPLNFVNNFSDVNKELLAELKSELDQENYEEVRLLVKSIEENEDRISLHGKRADSIVKSMLQHSRKNKGVKEATNINEIADEYLRLSYQGLRSKNTTFNSSIKTGLDPAIGSINIVRQDIERVLLNLFNNAFYAVNEKLNAERLKLNAEGKAYEPVVSVRTSQTKDKVFISINDNGIGIPQNLLDKIFQPFFTTKPTGQGTGLGLSLSYDIIKAHDGKINVETKEGEGTVFIVELPRGQ